MMRMASLLLCGGEKGCVFSFYHRYVQFVPHPKKQKTGGEDAFLSLMGVQAVFDGVSWWKEYTSVDAGLYSASLAREMYTYVEEELVGDVPSSSCDLLQHAYDTCMTNGVEGTSTALVATLQRPHEDEVSTFGLGNVCDNCMLDICSVGDCSALLVRGGKIVLATEEQTHDLDFPCQLGKGSSDTPSRALRYRFPVELGDMLLLATDGVFDNLYSHRVAEMMWSVVEKVYLKHMADVSATQGRRTRMNFLEDIMCALAKGSDNVMREARSASQDLHSDTPYAQKALDSGAYYEGGKQDDMTLLVSIIDEECDTNSGERFIRSTVMNPYPYRDWP